MSGLKRVLDVLEGVQRSGEGWIAKCPHHDDRHASLSVNVGRDGKVLMKCFSGCSFDEIVGAAGLEPRDLFERDEPLGGRGSDKPADHARHRATPSPGCTLEQYANAKRLPLNFPQGLGISEMTYMHAPAVRIPYLTPEGEEAAVRFRLALEKGESGDGRFRWRKRSKLCLYGLDRLEQGRRAGHLVLVE